MRKGSYRSLPRTNASAAYYAPLESSARYSQFPEGVLGNDDDTADDHYQMPIPSASHMRTLSVGTPRGQNAPGSSITSFTDFVNAPGRGRKVRSPVGLKKTEEKHSNDVEEVLFDSEELGRSRSGTNEENTSVSSRDDETVGRGPYKPSLTKERPRSGYSKNSLS